MSVVKNRYDDQENVQARKEQADPWIMYLIVRESLNMGAGKIAAQVGHGVGIVYERFMDLTWPETAEQEIFLGPGRAKKLDAFNAWSKSSFRKIVLKADDKEWKKLKDQLECHLVVDAGLTEIEAGSETVIALWPMLKSEAPPLVKRLRLL